MTDTGTPIHVLISDVPEKLITQEQPAKGLTPIPTADPGQPQTGRLVNGPEAHQPGQDQTYQQADRVATEAVQFSEASKAEAVQFNAASKAEAAQFNEANLSITGAQSSEAAVKKLHLLCRGATPEVAKVVQLQGASQAEARTRSNVANQAKAGARFSAATVKNPLLLCRGTTAEAAKVVQLQRANQAKAGARSSAASQAKAGARSSAANQAKKVAQLRAAAVIVGRAETTPGAAVHQEGNKFTGSRFGMGPAWESLFRTMADGLSGW